MGRNREDDRQDAFLANYASLGVIGKAARATGIERDTHYAWMHRDPAYAERFKSARAEFVESLEIEARRRAVDGVEEAVFFQGAVCGHITKYSDRLLEKLLDANAPEKYRQRSSVEHSGPAGGPINVGMLTDEQLENIASRGSPGTAETAEDESHGG